MILVLVVAAVAAAIALMRGGSLTALAETRLGWVWILAAALAVQLVVEFFWPGDLPREGAVALVVLTYAAAALFMTLNRRLPGTAIAATGLWLNALVIALNGAMPVSRWAASIASDRPLGDMGIKHEIAGANTVLPFLGDVIPLPYVARIISPGDVVLAIGIAILVYRRTMGDEGKRAGKRAATKASG